MCKMNIAINGFGRIGRMFLRAAAERDIHIVAINDLGDPATLAHLLKYDTVHGGFKGTIEFGENFLMINGRKIMTYTESDPGKLPWAMLGIDIVLESTGKFANKAAAS